MRKRKRIGVLFGGRSAEHAVSFQSARAIITHLDKIKYDVIPVGIDPSGEWHRFSLRQLELIWQQSSTSRSLFAREKSLPLLQGGENTTLFSPAKWKKELDLIFPVLHGPTGEDGSIQGWIKIANLPFVGADVLSSALCMDKGMTKQFLQKLGFPVVEFCLIREKDSPSPRELIKQLGLPLFIKPTCLGSSIGISKVSCEREILPALEVAFRFGERVIIEKYIEGREIECAVLGNREPKASLPGEIIPQHEFYTYEAKYLDKEGALFRLPAPISAAKTEEVQKLSLAIFQAMQCEGMARIDFFLCDDGRFLVNEINTIPGFTAQSLYPRLWEISGLPYKELLEELLTLAIERHELQQKTQGSIFP